MRASSLLLAVSISLAAPVAAQAPPAGIPELPSGTATLQGIVVHADGAGGSAGLPVTLFALTPEGRPGAGDARTDAEGAFTFEKISNRPGVVYLVSIQHGEIPFARRVRFLEGQDVARVRIAISDPTLDGSELDVTETEIRFDWIGSQLGVDEIHRVHNGGTQVVYVPQAQRASGTAPFEAVLPEAVSGFAPAAGMHGQGLERQGSRLLHWGPFYPGDNEVRYHYLRPLPASGSGEEVALRGSLAAGAQRLVVLLPEGDDSLRVEGFSPGESAERDGRRFRSWLAPARAPGQGYLAFARIPEATHDATALGALRADVWIELDDVALRVSQEFRVDVAGERRVAGSPDAPLLRFELPDGAALVDLTQGAEGLGVGPLANGDIGVVGPLPPGESRFGFRYRLPTSGKTVPVALRFPRRVSTLKVLVADTGIRVEDDRLHRLRPVRSGTRLYLRREGFNVHPDETVTLRLTPLSRGGTSRWASLSVMLIAVLAGAAFLSRPLLQGASMTASEQAPGELWSRERQAVYESIEDLEHDFETGKISDVDFQRMRGELRARAVALLRQERESEREASADAAQPPVTASFCPACGGRVVATWRFCTQCGGALSPDSAA